MTFLGAYSCLCEQSESIVCVAVAQVTLPNRIQMALTEMQTSERAAELSGKQANFRNWLHINSLRETFLVGTEITQASDTNFTLDRNKHKKKQWMCSNEEMKSFGMSAAESHHLYASGRVFSCRAGPNAHDR